MINALLVRYAGGWHEVTDPAAITTHGRREALLGVGALPSTPEVERVARQQLAHNAAPKVAIAAGYQPRTADELPYLSWAVGDTVTLPGMDGTPRAERVVALTVSEDDDGRVTFAPELADVAMSAIARWEQALKKMADGTLGGTSRVAQPASTIATSGGKDCCPPPTSGGGG
jgi:hypothetical protein